MSCLYCGGDGCGSNGAGGAACEDSAPLVPTGLPPRSPHSEHITLLMDEPGPRLACDSCGDTRSVSSPINVRKFLRLMEQFAARHRSCAKRKEARE